MTAHELAKRLLEGPDVMVTIRGYEGGVNEVDIIKPVAPIHLKVHTAWYYGAHEYHDTKHCYVGSCGGGDQILPETVAVQID